MTHPVFIVCRDWHTPLVALLNWLESVDCADEVYLIDNASTWPPLLEFYDTTRHIVIRTGVNGGHQVAWNQGLIRRLAHGRRFIVTDPDLVPDEGCPSDAIARMGEVLDQGEQIVKCGFSLRTDDLPEHFPDRDGVVEWESRFWQTFDHRVGAWKAAIDTTFALYSPVGERRFKYRPAYRLPAPYLMRHMPWYLDPANLSDEEAWYVAHADPAVSNVARMLLRPGEVI